MTISLIDPIQYDASALDERTRHALEFFVYDVTPKIDDLNETIDNYNLATSAEDKIALLKEIKQKYKIIDEQYPDSITSKCPDYITKIHQRVFQEIIEETQTLTPTNPDELTTTQEILSHLVETMHPETVNQIAIVLSSGKEANLAALRTLNFKTESEKTAFNAFLDEHEITYLGGANSKNFQVLNKATGAAVVLKLENRMAAPRCLESELREGEHASLFVPVHANRQVTYETEGERVVRGLMVTDKCDGSDLQADINRFPKVDERVKRTSFIGSQMAHHLKSLQQGNAFFRDMKNTNWLVSQSGQVQLADGKSFAYLNEANVFTRGNIQNRWFSSPSTPYMNPSECISGQDFSGEKAHVQMLGRDLYQYLTQCHYLAFYHIDPTLKLADTPVKQDASELDFSHDIFKTEDGIELEALIRGMIKTNPEDRISLEVVESKLAFLSARQTLKDVKAIKRDENNQKLNRLILRIEGLLEHPEKNAEHMHEIKLKVESIKLELDTLLKNTAKESEQLLKDISGFQKKRINKKPVQDRPLITFQAQMEKAIKKAFNEGNLKQLSKHHQTLSTVRDNFHLLKDIKALTKDNPTTEVTTFIRASDTAIRAALTSGQTDDVKAHLTLVKDSFELLDSIDALRVRAEEDTTMNQFIETMRSNILNTRSAEETQTVFNMLTSVQNQLEQTQQIILATKNELGSTEFRALLKSTDIQHAMVNVPLEERADFVKNTFKEALNITPSEDTTAQFQAYKEKYQNAVPNTQSQSEEKKDEPDDDNQLTPN
ncbi:MAG: hypothetical protein K0U37_05980 [Gammaproteobacteria bacterium]|nr:hypothetical protein [Gammaproteobacteria bacterium]